MTECVIKWFPYLEEIPPWWINFRNHVDLNFNKDEYDRISEYMLRVCLYEHDCSYKFSDNDKSHPNRDSKNTWRDASITLTFTNEQAMLAFILEWS